jgi:hypothetical protein
MGARRYVNAARTVRVSARENIEEFPPKYALAGVERSTESETLPAVAIGNWLGG